MKKQIHQHLHVLTKVEPARHWGNPEVLDTLADYIDRDFKSYRLKTTRQYWNVGTNTYQNVIASYQPEKRHRLIIGAHYDVYATQPGADDNASGVAGMLALAEKISAEAPSLPFRIDFVAYCLEEPPHFGSKQMGSYVHAASLSENNASVLGMICLDMIGYFDERPNSQHYPIQSLAEKYPSEGNYIALIGLRSQANFVKRIHGEMEENEVPVIPLLFPSSGGVAGLSDHRNYWHFGYNAVLVNDTGKYRNPNYHKKTDTMDTLDIDKMIAVVESLYTTITRPKGLVPNPTQPKKRSWWERLFG